MATVEWSVNAPKRRNKRAKNHATSTFLYHIAVIGLRNVGVVKRLFMIRKK